MKTMATLVKAMLVLAGLAVAALWVAAMLLVALIELLIKALIPIAIVVAIYLILRARRRRQPTPQAASPEATTQPQQAELPAAPAEPAPPEPISPALALPPVQAHKHRSYVVVGRDNGFTAPGADGYLHLNSADPCAPAPADHSALLARHLGRRTSRARSTRP